MRVLVCLGVLVGAAAGCGGGGGVTPEGPPLPPADPALLFYAPELEVTLADFELRPSGLYVQDVEIGEGPVARRTSRVWIHYVGWLPDGTVFDGSLGGDPYHTRLGGNEVIRGWNEGIAGMRRGGVRRLVVPPHLAYGSRGRGDVPPGATLVFQVELVDVD
jgi:peptidylprolyl isomerase